MIYLERFTLADMARISPVLRRLGSDAGSMEEVATRAVQYTYDTLVDTHGEPACALVRFFKTHRYDELPADLQTFARGGGTVGPSPGVHCLTLLASAGATPALRSRSTSRGHQAIPLTDEAAVAAAPMIASLIGQLGLELRHLVHPQQRIFLEEESTSFNVFHVHHALGSPLIPHQEDFVIPQRIRSVIGFGGALPSGHVYAMILFSRVAIDAATAQLFKPLALSLKLAVVSHERKVFA